jgi:hypothetical protein
VQVSGLVTGDEGIVYIDILPNDEENQQPGIEFGVGVVVFNNCINNRCYQSIQLSHKLGERL